jgi:hypothetical protein
MDGACGVHIPGAWSAEVEVGIGFVAHVRIYMHRVILSIERAWLPTFYVETFHP